jgi:hypothetical protein
LHLVGLSTQTYVNVNVIEFLHLFVEIFNIIMCEI